MVKNTNFLLQVLLSSANVKSGAFSPFCFSLFSSVFVFQPTPFLSLPFESPANNMSVCCMLPQLFLDPDALFSPALRPTNPGFFVYAKLCKGLFWKKRGEFKQSVGCLTSLLKLIVLSGPQQPPGGFGTAPGLSGGQKDKGDECRHQVDILIACHLR